MSEQPAPGAPDLGARAVLAIRDFRLLWLGQAISDFGDNLTSVTLMLLVNRLTGSTAAVAGILIVLAIPQLAFGLLAGVYVDRHDRKRIMLASDLLRGALVLGFVLVASADRLWLLYAIAFVQASIGTFFRPARGALVPTIVPARGLLAANSIGQVSYVIATVLGAAAAGVFVGVFNIAWPAFVIDALTFFVSFAFVSRVAAPARAVAGEGRGSASDILRQLSAGLGTVARNRALIGTLVAVSVTVLGLGAVNVLLVPLIVNDLKLSELWFGGLEFAQTSSMVLSGGLVALVAARIRPTRIVSGGLAGLALAVGLMSQVGNVWHLAAVLFGLGWIMTPLNAALATIVQTAVPSSRRS